MLASCLAPPDGNTIPLGCLICDRLSREGAAYLLLNTCRSNMILCTLLAAYISADVARSTDNKQISRPQLACKRDVLVCIFAPQSQCPRESGFKRDQAGSVGPMQSWKRCERAGVIGRSEPGLFAALKVPFHAPSERESTFLSVYILVKITFSHRQDGRAV